MLGLGLGLNLHHGRVPDQIKQLFAATGAQGAYYDPSDLSTLFQDTAGTTPVTAVGQSVALIKDKSGNGNDASQATAANQPTLQKDASGFYYLSFDGTSHYLAWTATNASMPSGDAVLYVATVGKYTDPAVNGAFMSYGSSTGSDDLFIVGNGVGNFDLGLGAAHGVHPSDSALHVFESYNSGASENFGYLDGVQVTDTTGTAGAFNSATDKAYLGSQPGGTTPGPFNGYGFVVFAGAGYNRAIVTRTLGAKAGLSL